MKRGSIRAEGITILTSMEIRQKHGFMLLMLMAADVWAGTTDIDVHDLQAVSGEGRSMVEAKSP